MASHSQPHNQSPKWMSAYAPMLLTAAQAIESFLQQNIPCLLLKLRCPWPMLRHSSQHTHQKNSIFRPSFSSGTSWLNQRFLQLVICFRILDPELHFKFTFYACPEY